MVYPLGIVSLASRLAGLSHDIAIIDMNMEGDAFGALKQKLLAFEPEVVGVSLRNIDPLGNKATSLIPPFFAAVRMISALQPGAKIIAGGTGFSLFPERLMRELPGISYGIVGEAEESLPALLSSLDNPPSLKGLCRRNGEEIIIAGASQEFDMARYIPPKRALLDPSRYLPVNSYVPAVGIESKRGCPFTCSYCVYPALQGKRLRCRPPSSVAEEMEILHKDYGIVNFHFTDPVLNIPDGHLEAICDELIRKKLRVRWDGFMREDRLNEKNVALFEKAGCECFSFSPDGLHQNALDILGKNLRVADILRAADLVSGTGVVSVYHFMVNVPGETEKSCSEGFSLLDRLYDKHSGSRNLGTIVLNNIRILPGTPIEAHAKAEGAIRQDADILYPAYYNPAPFETLRYRMENMHFCKNIFMWNNIK